MSRLQLAVRRGETTIAVSVPPDVFVAFSCGFLAGSLYVFLAAEPFKNTKRRH
jgi:hypothetical protein